MSMNPVRKRKLTLLFLFVVILSIVATLVLYALRQNISLFYTPTQMANGLAPLNHSIRVGGMVVKGSVVRHTNLTVGFQITDFIKTIDVSYQGVLPDLFREGQGVVVQGLVNSPEHLKATEVLAKHDENYMPPEVKQALGNRAEVNGYGR